MSLPADDLLSAFHDGEVNSAERAVVDQRLTESVEARRELSEIRQVSSLLKELPRGHLPAEFPQQVLQAIEREMLIPSQAFDAPSTQAGESIGGGGWSRRWVGASAVLTSAVGLLLLVRIIDNSPGRGSPAVRQLAESSNLPMASSSGALDAPMSSREAPGGFGGVPAPRMAEATSAMSRRNSLAGGSPGSSIVAQDLPSKAPSLPFGLASRESEGLVIDRSGLRDAMIGDVVRAMQTEGSEVAVVWLTVVDRQAGLEGLQFLLSDNRIARDDADEKKAERHKATQPEARASQMHAVFVESNPEQLTATLKQLRKENFWQSIEVDQPIELAQLDDVRYGRVPNADRRDEVVAKKGFEAKADVAKEASGPLSAKDRAKTPSRLSSEKKIAGAAAASKPASDPVPAGAKGVPEAKGSLAKQVTFNVPLEALVQNQNLNQLTRNRGVARNSFHKPTAHDKIAETVAADQRPMQVLFVVVDQVQAGKMQSSPNNSQKPAAVPAKTRAEPAKPAGQDGAA